jgi:O-antigen/teichoic acid export membrane protein
MPKIPEARDRGRFLFSYTLILLAVMAAALVLFRLVPKSFEFLLQRDFDMRNYGWFILLTIVIVAAETLASAASSLMLIKVTAIARQMTRTILLPLVAVLFFLNRSILADHGMLVILGGFFAGYLASAVICAIGISREHRFQMQAGWMLPRGFWAFSLSTMLATVFSFLYSNFDRMAVLSIQDVKGLGMYQAVISLSSLTGLIPQLMGATLVPMFSTLLAAGKMNAVRKAYDLLHSIGSVLMAFAALFLIAYSNELLALFGDAYASYSYLLSLFSVQYVVTSLHIGNTPILTALEKNAFRLGVSLMQILIQIGGTLAFAGAFGVLAIALAKTAGSIFANAASTLYVTKKIGHGLAVPRRYRVGVGLTIICMIVRNGLLPSGWGVSTMVFLAFAACLWIGAQITMAEVKNIVALVHSRKVQPEA